AGFAALYKYVPNTFVRWEHAWAGAIFTSIGLELAQRVLALYLTKVPVYTTIYGAFSAVPIFLIWMYVSWLVVLMGAVVAAYTPSLLSQVKRWPDTPGHRFQLSLAILKALAAVQHDNDKGYSAERLANMLRTDPLQIEPLLEILIDLDWVALLDEADAEGGGRYILLCDPPSTALAPLVGRVLLQPDGFTMGFWSAARLDDINLAQALRD
ncbi:MAG TPA: YhjD/YihY/BrkB family envelope integrity protein, partial [Aquabacterium sp.]|nr:YhjD/YihY/BrkB family envelope integrity protein [Aquabacterium sp.]